MDTPGTRYEKTLILRGHTLRILMHNGVRQVYYKGKVAAASAHENPEVGLLVFTVREEGKEVVYDVAILHTAYTRSFVGRDGELVFCDDPSMLVDKTDAAVHRSDPLQKA